MWALVALIFQGAPAQGQLQITLPPESQTVVVGTNVEFRVEASGDGPLEYQWRREGVAVWGAVSNRFAIGTVLSSDAASYSVVVRGPLGSVESTDTVLSVLSPPTITVHPRDQSLAEWGSATLTVAAAGVPTPTLQWHKGGVAIAGATAGEFSIPLVQPFHSGSWSVVASNALGVVTSAVANVQVQRRAGSGVHRLVGWGYRAFVVPCGFGGAITNLAAGGSHSLALRADGTLVPWGNNIDGQSVVPAGLSNVVGAAGGQQFSLGLDGGGRVVAWGRNTSGELNVPAGLTNAMAITAGAYHALAVRRDGTVAAWGNNFSGQATVPAGLTNVTAVAAGLEHSLALGRDGTIVSWGGNTFGQRDVPAGLAGISGIAAGESHSAALRSNGTVAVWGQGSFGLTNVPAGLSNTVQIASGTYHLLALRANGTVEAWGDNTYRQSSVPAGLDRVIAVAAGSYHSLALRDDGTVVAWGGINRTGEAVSPSALENVVAIAVGNEDTLLLQKDGTVVSFGHGFVQQQPVPAGLGEVSDLSAGVYHNLSLLSNGTVVSWGSVGSKTNVPAGLSQVVAVAGGGEHSLALRDDGVVVPWGANQLGQTDVPPGLGPVLSIAAGLNHSLAIRNDGTVAEWGWDYPGRTPVPTGLSDVVGLAGGETHSLALRTNGTLHAWGNGADGVTSIPSALSDVVQIAAGGRHNLALSRDGSVTAWGTPVQGVTNVPAGLSQVVAVAAGPGRSLALVGRGGPIILRQPADVTVGAGSTAGFAAEIAGNVPVFFQWLKNGQALAGSGSTSGSLVLTNVQPADEASYTLVVSNAAGVVTSEPALLTVIVPPELVAQPQDVNSFAGSPVAFDVSVSGTAPIQYQWFKDGQIVLRSTNAAHLISAAGLAEAGGYSVVAANSAGSVTSRVAVLSIVGPPSITTQPQSVDAAEGSNAAFTVVVNGLPPLAYQWWKDGVALSDGTNSLLELIGVQTTDAGNYQVVVSNGSGSVTSILAVLTVGLPPAITAQPVGRSARLGGAASFSVTASGTEPLTYLWRKDGVALSAATARELGIAVVQESDAGSYDVEVHNAYGTVISTPAALSLASVVRAIGGTNATGNPIELAVELLALGTESFAGFTLDYDPTQLELTAVAAGAGAAGGTLAVITNEAGRVGITVTSAPESAFARGTQELARVRFVLGSTASTNVILFTNQPTDLSLQTTNGLATPAEYEAGTIVATLAAPVITLQPQSVTNAPGTNAVLNVEASGSNPLAYQWYAGLSGEVANPIANATNATFITPVLDVTTSYWVAVSNVVGTTNSDTATVTVEATDPVGLTWATPAAITYGVTLSGEQLNAASRVSGTFVYGPDAGALLPVGTQILSVIFTPENPALAPTHLSVALTVTPAPLTVQVLEQTNVVCGPLPVVSVRYTGLVAGDTPASLALPVSFSTTATNCSEAGDYPVTGSAPARWQNYAVIVVPGTLHQLADSADGHRVQPDVATMEVGEVRLFTMTATNSDGTFLDLSRAAAWHSSDPSVLAVRAGGFAVGVQAGAATVMADYNGHTSSVSIAVQAVPGRSVWVSPTNGPFSGNAGQCGCLFGYQSSLVLSGIEGVIQKASVVLLDLHTGIAASLEHADGAAATFVSLLERDRISDRPRARWGLQGTPFSLALSDDASQELQPYVAPSSGGYRPDANFVTGQTLAWARGRSANGTWTMHALARLPSWSEGGWMLVLDTAANTPPTLAAVPNVTLPAGAADCPVYLEAGDAETPLSRLRVSMRVRPARVSEGQAYWFARGPLGTSVLHLRPERWIGRTNVVTITVTDDAGAQAQRSFEVTVSPGTFAGSYTNQTAVALPAHGSASTYPSAIAVSGLSGRLVKATVTLHGLRHSWPDDLDFLLVSPDGRRSVLISDAGGGVPVDGVTLSFSSAAWVAPVNGTAAFPGAEWLPGVCQGASPSMGFAGLRSGTFLPVNYGASDTFPAPAPAGAAGANLDVFRGGEANGTWSLFVFDDTPGHEGALAGGWSLDLLTSNDEALWTIPTGPDGTSSHDRFLVRDWQTGDPLVQIESVFELSTGEALLELRGRAGTAYTLERSTNGVDWAWVAHGLVGSEEFRFLAVDHGETGRPSYRVSAGLQGPAIPQGRMVGLTHFSDGTSCLLMESTPGRATVLQGSTDLDAWFDLQTFIHPGGRAELLDFSPTDPYRFYRLSNP